MGEFQSEGSVVKTILVAIDGSDHANRAVELAADIAAKYEAKLLLLHVVDNRPLSDDEKRLAEAEYANRIESRAMASDVMNVRSLGPRGVNPIFEHHAETGLIIRTALGEGMLDAARRDAADKGVSEVETILENGDPAKAILDIAERRKANLIVIGSRGQSNVKALFLGSVSHKVANLSDINVITVK